MISVRIFALVYIYRTTAHVGIYIIYILPTIHLLRYIIICIAIDCIIAQLVRRRPCEKLTGTIRNAILRGDGAGDYNVYTGESRRNGAFSSPSLSRTWAAVAAPVARTRMLSLRTRETDGGAKPVSNNNKF